MANEDEGSKPGRKQPKAERKFSQQQYDFLISCSKKGKNGIKEWNDWRKKNPKKNIHLEGAYLSGFHLEGAFLNKAVVRGREEKYTFPRKAGMKYHVITDEEVEASKSGVYLARADFRCAYLEGVLFYEAHLEGANFSDAHLEGTDFWHTYLADAQFHTSIVDGSTLVWKCKVSRGTNFDGVGLDSACIDAGTKQLLEYNIRRWNWEGWYWSDETHIVIKRLKTKKGTWARTCRVLGRLILTSPVRVFWWVSDYGRSTWRIVLTFFVLAVLFGLVYWCWPGFVIVNDVVGDIRGFVHALYFSVVTMTTLGFGDIAANPDSWKGQGLLMLQVILGYILLGAMVTRFAVLFTAGGPAGKFSPTKTKETAEDKKNEV